MGATAGRGGRLGGGEHGRMSFWLPGEVRGVEAREGMDTRAVDVFSEEGTKDPAVSSASVNPAASLQLPSLLAAIAASEALPAMAAANAWPCPQPGLQSGRTAVRGSDLLPYLHPSLRSSSLSSPPSPSLFNHVVYNELLLACVR